LPSQRALLAKEFTAPSKELHVANRELGSIESIQEDGEIAIRTDSGRVVEFNIEDHPHLDHGHAVTSHSSQGQTADRVLIHADTEEGAQLVNSRMAYVSVSRGRYDAQIYTNDKAELGAQLSRENSHTSAIGSEQEHRQDHRAEVAHEMGASVADEGGPAGESHSQGYGEGAAQGESVGE